MIITLLSVTILIAGIIWHKYCSYDNELWAWVTAATGISATFICIMIILVVQLPRENDYEKKLYEKEVIEYRLENADRNIIGNELLYNDIVEFNNSLRTPKRYANSLWINWFYNADIASIEYIDYKGVS